MRSYKLGFVLILVALLFVSPAEAGSKAHIAPIKSKPYGKSYSQWSAAWWKWAVETPASVNPVSDTTGQFCAQGQSGKVWFLAGSFSSGPVTRTCIVPKGKALFFPLLNKFYGAFLSDPADQQTEAFLRDQVACIADAALTLVTIDGVPVSNPQQYQEKSVLFSLFLPEDNIFGASDADIPELTLTPVADQGVYLFVFPLKPGQHTLRWQGSSAACGFSQDITYHLTVQ
ncbi:MAG TPA: hypothetical protein VFS21_32775 [Roseiflexaceae bacterium]|nr:hypothetical protein [Roseiflexaceae bacterium]